MRLLKYNFDFSPQKFEKKVDKIQTECLRCIIKFNNNTEGLKAFLKHDDWHRIVTKCIDYDKPNVSVTALQVIVIILSVSIHFSCMFMFCRF